LEVVAVGAAAECLEVVLRRPGFAAANTRTTRFSQQSSAPRSSAKSPDSSSKVQRVSGGVTDPRGLESFLSERALARPFTGGALSCSHGSDATFGHATAPSIAPRACRRHVSTFLPIPSPQREELAPSGASTPRARCGRPWTAQPHPWGPLEMPELPVSAADLWPQRRRSTNQRPKEQRRQKNVASPRVLVPTVAPLRS